MLMIVFCIPTLFDLIKENANNITNRNNLNSLNSRLNAEDRRIQMINDLLARQRSEKDKEIHKYWSGFETKKCYPDE